MKKKKTNSVKLVVTQEAIDDFRKLSVSQRLNWLDEMRTFLSKTLPPETKLSWPLR